mgnify:FL=1|tara:strand:- start:2126 stop:2962 length:837 start_codon:yes stop_codon:yes gene_type:complete
MPNWITCIVLTKNNPDELKTTLQSIAELEFKEKFSIMVIESWKYENEFKKVLDFATTIFKGTDFSLAAHRVWPAPGIFSSMNQALKILESDYPEVSDLIFMNSGDRFAKENSLMELWKYKESIQIKTGKFFPAVFGRARILASPSLSWFMPRIGVKNPASWLKYFNPNHQAVLFSAIWSYKNHYNTKNIYYADRKVMSDALRGNEDFAFADVLVSEFNLLGHSSKIPTWSELRQKMCEPDRGLKSKFNEILKFLIPRRLEKIYPFVMYYRSKILSIFC